MSHPLMARFTALRLLVALLVLVRAGPALA